MRIAVVKAHRDEQANVWRVEHSDVDGLRVEGETFEAFCRNVADGVAGLIEGEHGGEEVAIEVIAHASFRARTAPLTPPDRPASSSRERP